MEKLDLVKVQSPSALLKGNVLSALWSHLLSSFCCLSMFSLLTVCQNQTRKYEAGRKLSLLCSGVIQFPLCDALKIHFYKEWSIKSVGENLPVTGRKLNSESLKMSSKVACVDIWLVSQKHRSESEIYIKNLCFHAVPESISSGKTTEETADSVIQYI